MSRTESVVDPKGMFYNIIPQSSDAYFSLSVGYVEFKNEESVPAAIQLTGQKLLGIPIIAQLTEAEKNRQVRNPEATGSNPNQIPFHRLYVGNIHFSITESDLQNVFEPFGELEFVQLQKEEQGRSRGYGFVQYVFNHTHYPNLLTYYRFRDPNQAREALEKMNGFDLAGRQFVLVLETISLLPNLPPVFCRDSKDRATNNNSRVLHSPVLVVAVHRQPAVAISTAPAVVITTKALGVLVPWTIPMLAE